MYKKFTQLGFVIGLFFVIVSIVLFINVIIKQPQDRFSLFTAVAFLLFGIGMMLFGTRDDE